MPKQLNNFGLYLFDQFDKILNINWPNAKVRKVAITDDLYDVMHWSVNQLTEVVKIILKTSGDLNYKENSRTATVDY